MNSSKKVLLTGSTGLIGREALAPLIANGFDVYALTIEDTPNIKGISYIKANLFDYESIEKIVKDISPNYLLHFAWITSEGYLQSPLNLDFLAASLNLLKHFSKYGGRRAVLAGTCLEYDLDADMPLKEKSPIAPKNLYSAAKYSLYLTAEKFCRQENISFAWGRIFYVYGKNEHQSRLTPYIINNLQTGQPVVIKHSFLEKDYMYSKDIAAAFVQLLNSNIEGAINICSGNSISLETFSKNIAKKLGKEHLLDLKNLPAQQAPITVGDNTRLLRELGFSPRYTLDTALDEILL